MTLYRPVLAEDIPAVARINVDVWRSTYRDIVAEAFLASLDYRQAEERWERFLQRPASIAIAAELDGVVIGYLMAGRERGGNEIYIGEIYALYLRDEHHGQGIGRGLLEAGAARLREAGLTPYLVWVLDRNPSVAFYRQCGGVLVERKQVEIGGEKLDESAYGYNA